MRKVFLTLLIFAAVSPCLAKYSGGTGEPNTPYQIATAADLNDIGNHPEDFNKCFVVTNDIDMSAYTGTQYKMIGQVFAYFSGTFDGNKHVIRNLTYTTTSVSNYVGLFGDTNNATIKNLGLENINISVDGACTGGLVGHLDAGTITNCYTTGSITTTASHYNYCSYAGGLVGMQFNSVITNSYSTVSITSTSTTSSYSVSYAGGLVGYNFSNSSITNCYSTGSITSSSFVFSLVGGLAGSSNGNITDSYSTGAVTSDSSSYDSCIGGLAGSHGAGTIKDCYSTGSVTSLNSGAGGLVGTSFGANIEKCYSAGHVSATGFGVYKGGLLGYLFSGTVTACFWDTQTSGQSVGIGSGNTGVTGETTAQMQTQNIFTNAGWDFNNVWSICEITNYPKLEWQILPGDIVCPDGVDFEDLAEFCSQWLLEEIPADVAPSGGDGIVNFADFAVFANQWNIVHNIDDLLDFTGQWLKTGLQVCSADISSDGRVDSADFALMAKNWLQGF